MSSCEPNVIVVRSLSHGNPLVFAPLCRLLSPMFQVLNRGLNIDARLRAAEKWLSAANWLNVVIDASESSSALSSHG